MGRDSFFSSTLTIYATRISNALANLSDLWLLTRGFYTPSELVGGTGGESAGASLMADKERGLTRCFIHTGRAFASLAGQCFVGVLEGEGEPPKAAVVYRHDDGRCWIAEIPMRRVRVGGEGSRRRPSPVNGATTRSESYFTIEEIPGELG